jgi:hypothetical protein
LVPSINSRNREKRAYEVKHATLDRNFNKITKDVIHESVMI